MTAVPRSRCVDAVAGWTGLLGCVLAVITDAIAMQMRGLNPLSKTVSRVSTGEHSWISDGGIIAFGVGWLFVAEALRRQSDNSPRVRIGLLAMYLLGLNIVLVALWNNYDRKSADDFGIHMILVYVFSALFPAVAGLLAERVGEFTRIASAVSWAAAGLWIIAGAGYFFVPDEWLGLFERSVLIVPILALAGLSWLLIYARPAAG